MGVSEVNGRKVDTFTACAVCAACCFPQPPANTPVAATAHMTDTASHFYNSFYPSKRAYCAFIIMNPINYNCTYYIKAAPINQIIYQLTFPFILPREL